nr:hypothetical protein [Maliponia aquimaris]
MPGGLFSVVTTRPVSVPMLEENIRAYGLGAHLGRVRDEIVAAEREDGVSTVVLGCVRRHGPPVRARARSGLRLIDGVRAATGVTLGLIQTRPPNMDIRPVGGVDDDMTPDRRPAAGRLPRSAGACPGGNIHARQIRFHAARQTSDRRRLGGRRGHLCLRARAWPGA